MARHGAPQSSQFRKVLAADIRQGICPVGAAQSWINSPAIAVFLPLHLLLYDFPLLSTIILHHALTRSQTNRKARRKLTWIEDDS